MENVKLTICAIGKLQILLTNIYYTAAVPTTTNFIATNGLPGKDGKDEDDHSRSSLYWQRQHFYQQSDKREAEAVKRNVRQRSTRGTTGDSRHKFASDSRQRKTLENVLLLTR